jgi:hypothetical protein
VVFIFVSSFSFSLAWVIAGRVPKGNVLNLLETGDDLFCRSEKRRFIFLEMQKADQSGKSGGSRGMECRFVYFPCGLRKKRPASLTGGPFLRLIDSCFRSVL